MFAVGSAFALSLLALPWQGNVAYGSTDSTQWQWSDPSGGYGEPVTAQPGDQVALNLTAIQHENYNSQGTFDLSFAAGVLTFTGGSGVDCTGGSGSVSCVGNFNASAKSITVTFTVAENALRGGQDSASTAVHFTASSGADHDDAGSSSGAATLRIAAPEDGSDETTPPDDGGDDTSTPPADETDDTNVGGDDTSAQGDDSQDDGDNATEDGLAPQPTPAPAHIAVTG